MLLFSPTSDCCSGTGSVMNSIISRMWTIILNSHLFSPQGPEWHVEELALWVVLCRSAPTGENHLAVPLWDSAEDQPVSTPMRRHAVLLVFFLSFVLSSASKMSGKYKPCFCLKPGDHCLKEYHLTGKMNLHDFSKLPVASWRTKISAFGQVWGSAPCEELDWPEAQSGTVPPLLCLHSCRHARRTPCCSTRGPYWRHLW